MKLNRRLNNFIMRVATEATKDQEDLITYVEYYAEYKDQIETDDYECLVSYAQEVGIPIPYELQKKRQTICILII